MQKAKLIVRHITVNIMKTANAMHQTLELKEVMPVTAEKRNVEHLPVPVKKITSIGAFGDIQRPLLKLFFMENRFGIYTYMQRILVLAYKCQ